MSNQTKKYRGLSPLLTHFAGLLLTVELKNGRVYHGTLNDADHSMNLTLYQASTYMEDSTTDSTSSRRKARRLASFHQEYHHHAQQPQPITQTQQPTQTRSQKFDLVHIRGSSIRYIIFPENINLPAMIKIGIERTRAAHDKYQRGKRTKRQA